MKEIMFTLQNAAYIHPNGDLLFSDISLVINRQDKIALTGNNGVGKSTLLKIIAGEVVPSGGQLKRDHIPYYVPQIFGQFNHLTVGQALHVDEKLKALSAILDGSADIRYFGILNDDWTIEERCSSALKEWGLDGVELAQPMASLSGGQKMKVFLAGISVHEPEFVLLDEPSNHLDNAGRQQLYRFIESTTCALMVVSHDRTLLNLLNTVCEMSPRGITVYGGNYDFYAEQKQIEINALSNDIHAKEKALRKAREKERETQERQQKLDARGKSKQEKAGVARIMMNTLRNNAENSSSKMKNVHAEKTAGISHELHELRATVHDISKMKFGFDNSDLHKGKILCTASEINFAYHDHLLWKESLSFQITSGQRIALKGLNGSGKTTLIKMILGTLEPATGTISRAFNKAVYIDQDYSLIRNTLSVCDQAQYFNTSGLQEHEIKTRLTRFLFTKDDWGKPCAALSGGERMRLQLCCLTIGHQKPDVIVLDEPVNNLDIQNTEILTAAVNEYQGTLIVVSHDTYFLEQIRIEGSIEVS